MSNDENLKPCPFCGSEDVQAESWMGHNHMECSVACNVCCGKMEGYTEAAAIADWNKRAVDAENDRLRAEVERLQAQAPVWISVDERLPDLTHGYLSDEVLTLSSDGKICNAFYHHLHSEWEAPTGMQIWSIVYWMPLPKAPDEGEANPS